MKQKGFYESEILDKLDEIARKHVTSEECIHSFRTRMNEGKWSVEFKYKLFDNYTIKLKRTEIPRQFKTLDAVGKWMKRMEISEFRVLLD